MATQTRNYGLTKPADNETADIQVINQNMDTIDSKMKEISDIIPVMPEIPVQSVNNKTGSVQLTAADVGAETPTGAQEKANAAATAGISAAATVQGNLDAHLNESASTSSKGHVQLYDGTDSTSTTMAATANSVKQCFQYANDGKTNIAGVIGSPALSSDTFTQLKDKIQAQKNTLATNLTAKGQSSVGTETLSSLAAKVANVNTGKRFAKGSGTTNSSKMYSVSGLTFAPKTILVFQVNAGYNYLFQYSTDINFPNGGAAPKGWIGNSGGSYTYNTVSSSYPSLGASNFSGEALAANTAFEWIAFE